MNPDNKNDKIILKLARNEGITLEEEKIFDKLCHVNKNLIKYFNEINLSRLNDSELESLEKLHGSFVTSTSIHLKIRVTFPYLYRLIVNKCMPGNNNERIKETRYLKYPPLEVVRKIGRYGRANTPDNNMFYATENIDGAVRELKPRVGDLGHYWQMEM